MPVLTKTVLAALIMVNLVDRISFSMLLPYGPSMVANLLGKERGDPSVAGYLGFLLGIYSLVEVACAWCWGRLSDKLGRRPILLVGLSGSAVATLLLGGAQTYYTAIIARVLDGFFCGNLGVSRTILGEIVDPANEAWAYGMYTSCNILGTVAGTALGGMFSEPATHFPAIFSNTVFDTRPFLLPSVVLVVFTSGALVMCCFCVPETRWHHPGIRTVETNLAEHLTSCQSCSFVEGSSSRVVDSPHLVRFLVGMYFLWSYWAVRFQGFVSVVSLPRTLGGFHLNAQEIGSLQIVTSLAAFMNQQLFFERNVKRFGSDLCIKVGVGLTAALTIPFPAYGLLADPDRFGFWRYVVLGTYNVSVEVAFNTVFPLIFMMLNRHCNDKNRAAANGLTQCLAALSSGSSTVVANLLVRLGCRAEADWPFDAGRYLVFYPNIILGFLGVFLVTRAPVPLLH
eukprot:TRINITY_DN74497_c0_g1_i1.p1 TRINITY_DN74497_c0_g1~~TRINITY_DN74497_c0_g1_i1.p1  ORF type:complete len:470 (-),score=28.35 TRINITY_DN74497_c0_g1_i1:69-1430(-)